MKTMHIFIFLSFWIFSSMTWATVLLRQHQEFKDHNEYHASSDEEEKAFRKKILFNYYIDMIISDDYYEKVLSEKVPDMRQLAKSDSNEPHSKSYVYPSILDDSKMFCFLQANIIILPTPESKNINEQYYDANNCMRFTDAPLENLVKQRQIFLENPVSNVRAVNNYLFFTLYEILNSSINPSVSQ
ncbi:MAG: hypothetical protein HOO06_10170 [Bdellovibrionaceae bacterium]|nr:hypothetical protein [Pseudobdellovibrionaceae bacterium]